MRLYEDDYVFLPAHQRNWISRFYSSWHYRQFSKIKVMKKKKLMLSAYLLQLVAVMKDARNEIGFLRKFIDRNNIYGQIAITL